MIIQAIYNALNTYSKVEILKTLQNFKSLYIDIIYISIRK